MASEPEDAAPTNGHESAGAAAPDPLLVACQQVAKGGVDALKQLGREMKISGRKVDVSQLTKASYAGQAVLRAIRRDAATDDEMKELGEVLQAPGAAAALITLPPGLGRMVEPGASVVPLLTDKLIEQLPHDEKTFARQRHAPLPMPDVSAMQGPRRPYDPDDSNEAGLRVPVHENVWVKVAALVTMIALCAYSGLRFWDLAEAHRSERRGWRTFYRICVVLVELAYGGSAVGAIISRTRRQRLEALSRSARDRPFAVEDALTVLMVTDEDEAAITACVQSHYGALKSGAGGGKAPPFRAVLVVESGGAECPAARAHAALSAQFPNLLLFYKRELAEQEYVLNADDEEAQAALNVVLEDNMYLGQVLFYALDRLFLQAGHAISNAAVVVMPASSVVDSEAYYPYVFDMLERPGFACVSTPTVARNKLAATDFIDVSGAAHERDTLSAVAADEKFAINATAFAARGYSLWRVLRRMEMENVDTQNLFWLTYAMHIESRQATIATMTQHAPRTSVLAPSHGPTVLSNVLDRQAEGHDVARIFDRERPFLSWNLHNPLRAPHDAARAAVLMEVTLAVVVLATVLGGVAPWSTDTLLVPAAFLVHYGLLLLTSLTSPFALSVTRVGTAMKNRVLAPAHAWLYFLNVSRFGVDRRGHFRAVGETTTADLGTYKERQREEKEAAMVKEHAEGQKAKEVAARHKEEMKAKANIDAVAAKQAKKDAAAKAKAEKAAVKQAAAEAKRKEKLRRARRGPKLQVVDAVAEGAETGAPDHSIVLDYLDESGYLGGEIQPAPPGAPQPVAEGFLSRGKKKGGGRDNEPAEARIRSSSMAPLAPNADEHSGETEATSVARGAAAGKGVRLLPRKRPRDAKVVKYKTPKAAKGGKRTGAGSVHRPHRAVKWLSVPLLVLAAAAAAVGVFLAVGKVIGSGLPENYTQMEIFSARAWYVAAGALAVFAFLPLFVYASYLGRFAAVTSNRVAGALLLTLSVLCVAAVGALPFLAHFTLDGRIGPGGVYDLDALHAAHMRFMAAKQAGQPTENPLTPPWRAAPSDTGVLSAAGESLEGGWYTGPGLTKVTWPQAVAMTELSFALVAHYKILAAMPSAEPGPELARRSAADDLRVAVRHGAAYLLAAFDAANTRLVAAVGSEASPVWNAEWVKPEARSNAPVAYVDVGAVQGAETWAAVTSALAAASVALRPWGEDDGLTGRLRTAAEATFTAMQNSTRSYASGQETAALAQTWPSSEGTLADDKLAAAALMLLACRSSCSKYRNAVNGYYTQAQQERTAQGRQNDFTMAVDDHWWPAQAYLFHADVDNTRYDEALSRFARAWTQSPAEGDPPSGLTARDGLTLAAPPDWSPGAANAYVTPGTLGQTVRAMSLVALHASSQLRESDAHRAATCFAQGQLRNILGLNAAGRSYVAGVAPDGASSPRQPIDRGAGPSNPADPNANPFVLTGALVHGPTVGGAYRDLRPRPENSGTSILNNSPLSTLVASLRSRGLGVEDCLGLRPRERLGRSTNVPDVDDGQAVFSDGP